ncbi:hypothetical protein HX13_22755 [Chryseobacterium sp. P1-3]|nr:hypothetical protein HX13_22755 [Chryseobacterium sp. P1-3]
MYKVVIFAPLKTREYQSSAEELLGKQEHYNTSKKRRTKKNLKNFFAKRVVVLKRVCIFAVRINRSAGVGVIEVLRRIKVT